MKQAIQSSIEVRFYDKEIRKDMPQVLEQIDEATPCPGSRPLLYPKGKIINENNEPVTNARITIKGNNASVIANIPGLRPIF
jgi:hypothetical protein